MSGGFTKEVIGMTNLAGDWKSVLCRKYIRKSTKHLLLAGYGGIFFNIYKRENSIKTKVDIISGSSISTPGFEKKF